MRYLLLTLFGFFGPALLMLLLRLTWFYLRAKLYEKLTKQSKEPEIIDVTPIHKKPISKPFIFLWILVSIICTALLIWQLDDNPAPEYVYIPAHIDAEGNFVSAQTLEEKRK
ncbi:MAG: hypothetical protein Q9N02_00480 [Ghiorsea sp.]|nr:hypothetical protein [Ghiorsea sp.]